MSRNHVSLILIIITLIFTIPLFAQDTPPEQLLTDEATQKLLQEMEDMGLSDEEGNMDMEALQKMMQDNMTSMFEQVEVPVGLYENTEYSYSFIIPEGWSGAYVFGVLTVVEGTLGEMMVNPDLAQPTMMIMAVPPDEIEGDIDIENADLDQIKADMEANEEEGVDLTVIDVKRAEVEGHKAIFAEMIQKISMQIPGMPPMENEIHSAIYMFEANDLRYNLMYASPVGKWDEYKEFFKSQVDNFKLK